MPLTSKSIIKILLLICIVGPLFICTASLLLPSGSYFKFRLSPRTGPSLIANPPPPVVQAFSQPGPAAMDIARLCQSIPSFFANEPTSGLPWLPHSVNSLHPLTVSITPDKAILNFESISTNYKFSTPYYTVIIQRDLAVKNPTLSRWIVSNIPPGPQATPIILTTFNLPLTDSFSHQLLFQSASKRFIAQAARVDADISTLRTRMEFYKRQNSPGLARETIRKSAATNPDFWPDQLLLFFIDGHSPAAATKLHAWVAANPAIERHITACYAHLNTGDTPSAKAAALSITTLAQSPQLHNSTIKASVPILIADLAYTFFDTGNYDECIALCDAATRLNRFHVPTLPQDLAGLKSAAQLCKTGTLTPAPKRHPDIIGPLHNIDINWLNSNPPQPPHPPPVPHPPPLPDSKPPTTRNKSSLRFPLNTSHI